MRLILTWLIIINLSSAPLHNAMVVVDDEAIEVGTIDIGRETKVEMPNNSSYRVIFTLGKEREEWLGTNLMRCDTLMIGNDTKIFEIDVDF